MRYENNQLNQFRKQGDTEADTLVESLFTTKEQTALYTALQTEKKQNLPKLPDALHTFLVNHKPKPGWYNSERILKGQQVFHTYAMPVMTLLGALSLPYCYAASPGNKALVATAKIKNATGKRLVDTAAFIIGVLTKNSLQEDADGHFLINKTRLIHALVRFHVAKNWSAEDGVPVNQEDMAGTNLAFSYMIIRGLKISGYPINDTEAEDLLYVWRYIGYQLQIDEILLPKNIAEAAALEEAIRNRHFKPSAEAVSLSKDLIKHYQSYFPPMASLLVEAQIKYWVGPSVSKILGLTDDFLKDEFVKAVNAVNEFKNKNFFKGDSYQIMVQDHLRLKKLFQQQTSSTP
jgi:ER-bound oxygenase mpaB/B'/Rubber oxygenase, catalytic domain